MGKDNSAQDSAALAQQEQVKLYKQLLGEAKPTRGLLYGQANEFLRGDSDVTSSPIFGAGKDVLESQYGRAKENIIAGTPTGGGLTAALADLEGSRASGLTQFTGALAEGEQNRATQLATFGTSQGSSALAQASQIAAQRAQAEGAANAGKASGTGTALGLTAAALATKNPAAAAPLVTPSDRRLKKNVHKIGVLGPYNLYAFDYLWDEPGVGVMAQEVGSTLTDESGYLMVDYGSLTGRP